MALLMQYFTLQFLDLVTTVLFLSVGVQEGNPLVVQAMNWAENPLNALFGVKALAMAIGFYCWSAGRHSLLRRANLLFAFLVVWNIVAFYVGQLQAS